MKKILNLLLCSIIFATNFIFLNTKNVSADTNDSYVVHNWIPNFYSHKERSSNWAQLSYIYANGEIAYCVDPGVELSNGTFSSSTDFSIANIGVETRRKLELYAAYGYNYSNHNTDKYYAATQELIWRELGVSNMWFTTEKQGGENIDVSAEKNEILRLVSEHEKVPSFSTNGKINVGNVTLTDNNNVLSNFDVISSTADSVSISGNQLNIYNRTAKNISIILKKRGIETGTSLVYRADGKQTVATLRISDPVLTSLNLEVVGGSLEIQKIDKDNQTNIAQGDAILKGAKYEILDENREHVTYLITDENGKYKTEKILVPNKRYILREVEPSKGYLLDTTEYEVIATENGLEVKLNVPEKVIERKIEFFKVFASDETGIMTGEPNITFDVILKSSGKVVKTLTTDSRGYMSTILPYGTYIFKQKNTTHGHEKIDDFEVIVNEDSDDVIYKVLSNAEIKAKLKVVKIDNETKNIIKRSNISFKIYDVDKQDYVCQTVSYPNVETYCEFKTDENGILYTPYPLDSGTYKLEEVDQVIDGYVWNKQSKEFTIDENSELEYDENLGVIFEVKFGNDQVKGKIEINKVGEELIIDNGYKYKEIPLPKVEFELRANEDITIGGKEYYKYGDLVSILTTDKNGQTSIDGLPLGKYILIEKSTDKNHVLLDEPMEFELKYKDQYTKEVIKTFNIKNYYKKGTLEFTKTDLVDGTPIPNVEIQIFTENDELLFTGTTDNDGKITITDLPVGVKMYLVETRAADNYKLTDKRIYFEILENGDIVRAILTNEKIVIDVPKTGLDKNYFMELISSILIAAGIGGIAFEIIKKRKRK